MKVIVTKVVMWFAGSADNKPGGASSKKLSLFWCIVILATPPIFTWMHWAYKHDDWGLLVPVLGIIFTYAAIFAGINSNEKIKGKADTTPNDNTDANKV